MHRIGGCFTILETPRHRRCFDLSPRDALHYCSGTSRPIDTVWLLHGVLCGIIQRCNLPSRRTDSWTDCMDCHFCIPYYPPTCWSDSCYRSAWPFAVGGRMLGSRPQRGLPCLLPIKSPSRTSQLLQRRVTSFSQFGLSSPPWMAYTLHNINAYQAIHL